MQSGSYHRIGKHDIWFGYNDTNTNILRVEWFGQGLRILNIKIKPESIIKSNGGGTSNITAKTNKGTITISHSMSGFTSIVLKWWVIPTFWASGKESGFKDLDLVEKICTTNKI